LGDFFCRFRSRGKYILRSSVSPQILLDWTTLDLLVTIKLKQQTFDIIFPSLERNSCMTVTRRTDNTTFWESVDMK
jgi:hypothetical protein